MIKFQSFILSLGFVILFMGCSELEDAVTPDNPVAVLDQQKLLNLVNAQRTNGCNCGGTEMPPVSAVTWNDQLAEAAQIHSEDMANNDHFEHTGTDGSSIGDRVRRVGYNWSTVAENIAWNYPDEDAVVQGWLDSPGHCRNIMNTDVTEMGVSRVGNCWTQIFATK